MDARREPERGVKGAFPGAGLGDGDASMEVRRVLRGVVAPVEGRVGVVAGVRLWRLLVAVVGEALTGVTEGRGISDFLSNQRNG